MYDFLGICLALALLLTVNALAAVATTTAWRFISLLAKNQSAATRSRLIFILRIFPALAAFLAVVILLIPSYLAFEPIQTEETVSYKLGLLAFFSAAGIALALWRGLATWLATKRLVSDWQTHSEIVRLENLPIPAYRITHQFPVVAVIGVVRPKLFVANQIFEALNAEELTAVIAHETAHVTTRDNLKHWLMRICRDVLVIFPYSRVVDKEWAEAIELAADEQAAGRKSHMALDLAQALIKIARLIPVGIDPTMPAGAFLIDGKVETGDALAWRVRRLTQLAEANLNDAGKGRERFLTALSWACFGVLLLVIVGTATNTDVLTAMHTGIERVVAFLS